MPGMMDTITRLMNSLKNDDGAHDANNMLRQNWDYPSFSSVLPYRYSDENNGLFINSKTMGFILEATPLIGANDQIVRSLDDLLRKKIPRKTPITVMMVASKCVGEKVAQGLGTDNWKGPMADKLNAITRAFYERAALRGFNNKRNYPLALRDYRVFIIYGKEQKVSVPAMEEMVQLRHTIRVSLENAKIDTASVDVHDFLSIMREMTNFRQGQVTRSRGDYNEYETINRQLPEHSFELEVKPGYLRQSVDNTGEDRRSNSYTQGAQGKQSTRIINLTLLQNPKKYGLWQTPDNLQNIRFPDLGVPCPFVITWCMEVEDQVSSSAEAMRKDFDLQKKAESAYAKLFPGTDKAAREWKSLRTDLSNGQISMCRYYYNVTLFCEDDPSIALQCELAAVNAFRKNDLELGTIKFQQMRGYLSMYPFMMAEGLWDDLKLQGATLRAKSFNALNLMPVVADNPMTPTGLALPTYRNQVAFYDMFSDQNGNANFNIAVTGTSGAGKSFLVQSMLRQVLNTGGFAWVIDMGDSYKNYCKQVGGTYLDGKDLRFNPFANVKDISLSVEGICRLITVLASPAGTLDEVSEAVLQDAVLYAWEAAKNKAKIDHVVHYLNDDSISEKYSEKPTVLARMAELAVLLDKYCTWGVFGEYFNSESPSLTYDTQFAVLELLSLESQPKLMAAILFSLILAIQEKMYHSPRDLKKLCIIDEAWRLLSGSNQHAAKFIETGYRTVRRHTGAFVTITQGIKDFTASKEAEAAWQNSATKITLLQDAKAFKTYLKDNPDQFSDMETEVIRRFQKAEDTHFSSLLISIGENGSFHRLFVDPVTRAMCSSKGKHFNFMQEQQRMGKSSEEAAYMLAKEIYTEELAELEQWADAA
ncbi:type IV secretion system protein TraC [Serratia plymuthica]|uniref:type IV secretion system protein TraC n=1 Tax=Serratia plymuthica TaxID=82996 RepID=UPI0002EE4EA1|nr:type IV secretion system protein TraC [Serratia plymuthica]